MKILVIVPVFNEEKLLLRSLFSFFSQTYKDITYILVNDASTDKSQQVIEEFIKDKPNFNLINLTNKSEHVPGAKVVRTFYAGLESLDWKNFQVIVKLDADIILPINYFDVLIEELIKDTEIGIIGGLVYIEKNGKWVYENISNKQHVRGPIKTYRRECFEDIGGLREILGWDNLDILLARMHSWKVRTIQELQVKHLKPTAQVYQKTKAEKLGKYFYNIGLDSKLAFISCAKASWKDKSFKNFMVSFRIFLKMKRERAEIKLFQHEIDFIRKYRWNEIFKKFR